jgi:hypothetical protein
MKQIYISLLAISFLLLLFQQDTAGSSKKTVPTGVEINNPYLENLFVPDFPYDSVRVIEQKDGEIVVVIKAKEKVSDEMFKQYFVTLEKRNIWVERVWDTKHGVLELTRLFLVRQVPKEPYVIEYSKSIHKAKDITVGLPHNIVWKVDNYMVCWIDKGFGSKFNKIIIYPDADTLCPIFPLIEKYPQSKCRDCYRFEQLKGDKRTKVERSNQFVFRYISKDPFEKICHFYRERLIKRFKQHGMLGLEKYDWNTDLAGIKVVDSVRKGSSWRYLEMVRSQTMDHSIFNNVNIYTWEAFGGTSKKIVIPKDGEVFKVTVSRSSDKWTKDFNFITVFYETDSEAIQRVIKMYSEIDKWRPN